MTTTRGDFKSRCRQRQIARSVALRRALLLTAIVVGGTAAFARPATRTDTPRNADATPHRFIGVLLVTSEADQIARAAALFSDELLGRLGDAAIESALLTPHAALAADSGMTLPDMAQADSWPRHEPGLRELAKALGLSDVVVVRLAPKTASTNKQRLGLAAQGLWIVAGAGSDTFALAVPGEVSDNSTRQLAADIAARLINSPAPTAALPTTAVAPAAAKPADKPAGDTPPPATKPTTEPTPAAPDRPAPVTAPAAAPSAAPATAPATAPSATPKPPAPGPATTAPGDQPAPTAQPATPTDTAPAAATPAPAKSSEGEPAELPPAYDSAIKALREDNLNRAMDFANQALAEGAPRSRVCLLRAMIFAARHDVSAEVTELETAIEADPKLIEPRLKLAELQNQRGLWQDAMVSYKQALAQDKTATGAYIGLARLYESNRQPRAAQETLEQGAQATPDDPLMLLELGDLYARRGMVRQAEVTYTNAARLGTAKNRGDALQKLGDIYASTQRYREAFICYAELSRSGVAGGGIMADKRYRQVMGVTDKAIANALQEAFSKLERYVQPPTAAHAESRDKTPEVTRVEAYQSVSEAARQIKEMAGFAADVLPAPGVKTEHAQRALYYSLAQEATVSAQTYLDTGDKDTLKAARARLADAHDEQAALAKLTGG